MSESNAQLIHSLCTEQADAFVAADDLLPESYQNNPERVLAACLVAHAYDINPVAVMLGQHLKTPAAAAPKAEKPEKPQKEQDAEPAYGWPRKINGIWTASDGATYDKTRHGWNKETKQPSVKPDGTFRKARRAKQRPETTSEDVGPAADNHSEQDMISANQVLASFKGHIDSAADGARLEQLGGQIELMGFTPDELTVARRWIAERVEALEQA